MRTEQSAIEIWDEKKVIIHEDKYLLITSRKSVRKFIP